MMKILLIQTSFLGDTVLSTPVFSALKSKYPQAEIWVLSTPASACLIKRDPNLAGVIEVDKKGRHKGVFGFIHILRIIRKHNFDIVYSLHKSFRTGLLVLLSGINERIGFKQAKLQLAYTMTKDREKDRHDVIRNLSLVVDSDDDLSKYDELKLYPPSVEELSGEVKEAVNFNKQVALIFPGSIWPTKRWSVSGFSEVSKYLVGSNFDVYLMGSNEEKELCNTISVPGVVNLAGKFTLDEVVYIVSRARLIVCNDSLPLHLASAFKIPTVTVFCATSSSFGFGPWKNKAFVVEKLGLSCRPCRRHGGVKCPTGTWSCINDLKSGEVISAINKVMD